MQFSRFIKTGWLIDGSGNPPQKDMLLTVENGFFTAIEPCPRDWTTDLEHRIIDLSTCTVLPPLVDCHVHLTLSGSADPEVRQHRRAADYEASRPVIAEHLHNHFTHGVLAVRDGGDDRAHVLRFKKEGDKTGNAPVVIQAAGRAWHNRNRYGSFIGRTPGKNKSLAAAFLRDTEPVDHVKIINSGLNSLSIFGHETAPQFSPTELALLAVQAHREDKPVMVHANGRLPVRLALEAGCDSIEHGFFMGLENLKLMAETQTTWVPTACTMKALANDPAPCGSQVDENVVQKNLQDQMEQIQQARRYGVPIALGTDAGSRGVLHGKAVVEEIQILIRAGCSLAESIQSATVNGARLLGLDFMGGIVPGKPAHFIAAGCSPAMLPEKLYPLEGVYLNGTPCSINFKYPRPDRYPNV